MKKLKYLAISIIVASFLLLSTACEDKKLDTPKGFNLDDAYTLYWSSVPNSRGYELNIRNVNTGAEYQETSRHTYFSFAELPEGDYEIEVRAIGGMNNELYSDWAEPFSFERAKESGIIFELINGKTEYAVTKVGTASGEVEIESVYRGKPVTTIADNAFRGKGSSRIVSVKVGENVKTIGESAFYNCTKMTSIEIPESVTSIGVSAFQGCNSLKSVTLPQNVTQLSPYIFAYCRGLEEVKLGENVAYIGESAFFRCSGLRSVELPDSVVYVGQHAFEEAEALESVSFGSGIQGVDEYAFYTCTSLESVSFPERAENLIFADRVFENCIALSHIDLPDGLTQIGGYDFYRCSSLAEVTIPESVTRIGEFAFRDTALYFDQSKNGDGFIYADHWLVAATDALKMSVTEISGENLNKEGLYGIADQTFIVNYITEQGNRATSGAPNLQTVEIPASIHYIGIYAFYRCPLLEKVTAEAGSELKSLGDYAFSGCGILRNVQFEEGLEEIGSYAFANCTVLGSHAKLVPSTVTRIGTYAFNGTGLWANAAEEGGIVYASDWVVGYNGLTETSVSFQLKDGEPISGVADFAFYKNTSVQNITGLASAKHIGRGAFFGCTSLSLLSLNDNLKKIEDNTFSGCSSLFLANLPMNLESVGLRAFYNCTMLDEIDLSYTNVSEVGEMAFYGCFNVKKITLGENLKTIGARAFAGLSQITELVIPNSVEVIGDYAFSGCSVLEEITFGSLSKDGTKVDESSISLKEIGMCAFQNCSMLKRVEFPESLETIGNYAFYRCAALESVNFGGGVKNIGRYAFAVTSLKMLFLPANIETVGDYAFKNCKQLASVVIAGTPASIGAHAFLGSGTLTVYCVQDSESSSSWNARWNSAFRPVLWNCTLGEGGDYIESFTVEFENVSNPYARFGVSGPQREGYEFLGWALTANGEVVYGADEWRKAEMGTTLYSVWRERPADDVEQETESDAPETESGINTENL